jgi:hypothetical protein
MVEGANERVCVRALIRAGRRNMRSWRDRQEEEDGDDATLRMSEVAS